MTSIGPGLRLHFVLELAAMVSLVHWGFNSGEGQLQRVLLGLLLPMAAAAVWGIFRVPDDPGPALVAIPGSLRLLIELVVLGGAATALYFSGQRVLGILFAITIIIDYALMRDRVRRLMSYTNR